MPLFREFLKKRFLNLLRSLGDGDANRENCRHLAMPYDNLIFAATMDVMVATDIIVIEGTYDDDLVYDLPKRY